MPAERLPAISIIIPVWNGMPFLQECLESVLIQDFQDWELIISDDGSTDDSLAFLATLKDPRIRLFRQQKNLGIFGNLNFIFRQARGPVSQILCQDDFFVSPYSLRRIVDYWGEVDSTVGYACFNQSVLPDRGYVGFHKRHQPRRMVPSDSDLWFFVIGCMPGNLSNVTLKTSIVQDCGWFNENLPYVGDFEFWVRAGRRYVVEFLPDLISHVRSHSGQASCHLNRYGEYVAQEAVVVGNLFNQLISAKVAPEHMLRIHATMRYFGRQLEIALRQWLRGNTAYLREIMAVSPTLAYRLNPIFSWTLLILTLGGRFGPSVTGRYLLSLLSEPLNRASLVSRCS